MCCDDVGTFAMSAARKHPRMVGFSIAFLEISNTPQNLAKISSHSLNALPRHMGPYQAPEVMTAALKNVLQGLLWLACGRGQTSEMPVMVACEGLSWSSWTSRRHWPRFQRFLFLQLLSLPAPGVPARLQKRGHRPPKHVFILQRQIQAGRQSDRHRTWQNTASFWSHCCCCRYFVCHHSGHAACVRRTFVLFWRLPWPAGAQQTNVT